MKTLLLWLTDCFHNRGIRRWMQEIRPIIIVGTSGVPNEGNELMDVN